MLMATASVSAYAQDIQETIIVTGPGPNRSASELIGNATALDRDDLIKTLSGTLGDTLDKQPGVSTSFFGAGASRPILRGLGAERVLILTNGIGSVDVSATSPDHQVASDAIDAQRIEILRGPAALAYGGQAIGGVVNVIDGLIVEEKPEDPFSAELFSAYNSVNEGTDLAGRGAFTVGDFVFTLSGSSRDFDNYEIPSFVESSRLRASEEEEHHDEDDHEEDEHDEEEHHEDEHEEHEELYGVTENTFLETETLAAGISWVGETAFAGIGVRRQTSLYGLPGHDHGHDEHDDDHEDENEHGDEEHHDEDEHEEEGSPFIDLEQTRIDFRGGLRFKDSFVKSVVLTAAVSEYEHTEFEAIGEAGTLYTNQGYETRLEIDHEISGFEGAWGIQLSDKELASIGEESFIGPTSQKNVGIFAYETIEWDSGFGLEGGLRVDQVEYMNEAEGSRDFELFNASLGAHQHWESGFFVGAQLGYSERAPNETELFAFGPHFASSQFEVGDASLDKEEVLNLESSIRWKNENTSLALNLFVNEFENFIYLTSDEIEVDGTIVDEVDELPVFSFKQQDADFQGGEISFTHYQNNLLFGADWELKTSLEYVEAELADGSDVPFIPPLTINASALAEWKVFDLGADLVIASDQSNSGEGYFDTDGYSSLDLSASLDLDEIGVPIPGAELFLDVRNVTDEEIRYSTSVLKDTLSAPGRNIRFGFKVEL